jgi:hypothetical protein
MNVRPSGPRSPAAGFGAPSTVRGWLKARGVRVARELRLARVADVVDDDTAGPLEADEGVRLPEVLAADDTLGLRPLAGGCAIAFSRPG